MTADSSIQALARAASALVREHDLTDVMATLLDDAVRSMGATSGGLLMLDGDRLELLAATSHSAEHLELFQMQEQLGPCHEAITTGQAVEVHGAEAIAERWADVGAAIVAAGHSAVRAHPMTWRGDVLGAVNLFGGDGLSSDQGIDLPTVGQAFADMATLVILTPERLSDEAIAERTRTALAGRTVVERAKGVLAYVEDLTVDAAYERLRELAGQGQVSLTAAAEEVLSKASAVRE